MKKVLMKSTKAQSPGDRKLPLEPKEGSIDEGIFPLVKALNEAGLRTTQSCSGHHGIKGVECAEICIDMECVEDVAFRQNGKRLVIWWKRRTDGAKFVATTAERGEVFGTIGEMVKEKERD